MLSLFYGSLFYFMDDWYAWFNQLNGLLKIFVLPDLNNQNDLTLLEFDEHMTVFSLFLSNILHIMLLNGVVVNFSALSFTWI